ncbi:MAG: endonuclease domain-containing protein [Deltaproteobacteria bacterium]|nr:endonuclease domain-containing protein [Deltaproteobacteria bacterium]
MDKGKNTTEKARLLRRTQTPAESILWRALRYQKLGVKFRRQEPIDHYIADFCCVEKRLIIELDGGIHNEAEQIEYDQDRDTYLQGQGFQVIRFKNAEVENNLGSVVATIALAITSPLPPAGEGNGDREVRGG